MATSSLPVQLELTAVEKNIKYHKRVLRIKSIFIILHLISNNTENKGKAQRLDDSICAGECSKERENEQVNEQIFIIHFFIL